MEPLTEKQIQSVINWMNEWEQLKDTSIPMRFKEDFAAKLNEEQKQYCNDEWEDDFVPCEECDLPDACADFGCAIKAGLRKSESF